MVQPFKGWVGNEGVDINWDASPVSSPVTVLSHCGKFIVLNKSDVKKSKICSTYYHINLHKVNVAK